MFSELFPKPELDEQTQKGQTGKDVATLQVKIMPTTHKIEVFVNAAIVITRDLGGSGFGGFQCTTTPIPFEEWSSLLPVALGWGILPEPRAIVEAR